jgi:hypothetical protein
MTKRIVRILLAAALVMVSFSACHRRPLEDPSEAVRIAIKVDVKTVTNVNANIRSSVVLYGSNTTLWEEKLSQLDPELMRVLVYDPETNKLLTQSFISAASIDEEGNKVFMGSLGISHGNYNFLVYNFDTPTTQVSQENNEASIIAYTDEISANIKARYLGTKAEEEYEDINIHYEPEHLLVANEKDVRISPHDTLVVVRTEASTVVDTYYLQVRVKGMQFASSATAVISGLSPSNHIGYNERTIDPSAAVVFEMQKGQDLSLDGDNKDVLCAVFNTFGKIDSISSNLYVTFNVYDTAGNLRQYSANLDTVFNSEEAKLYHWLIVDESCLVIDIPDPGVTPPSGGNGGFQPVVDDWTEETGEISL